MRLRLAYMDQVPVFDADGITPEAKMWALMWWDENPFKMWFSTPRVPRSIETPTLAARTLYESWPSGAFVPIYLVAKILGVEPSVTMVNWINATQQGLISLAAAFIGFNLALLNRLNKLSSCIIALAVSLPILLSSGLIYIFSQIYDVVTAVLIYTALFILLEVLFYRARSPRDRQIIAAVQLATIYGAFLVDWLSYTLFAFWMLTRLAAGFLGVTPRVSFRRLVGLSLLPVSAFLIYLCWRFFAPGSVAASHGISSSIRELIGKIMERMNLTDESHISGFGAAFVEMHDGFLWGWAFPWIVGSVLIALVLLVIAFLRARDETDRRTTFATLSVLVLVTVPFYVHMLVLYQHTFIHRWAITKAMLALSLVPFAIVPIAVFTLIRQSAGATASPARKGGLATAGVALAVVSFLCSADAFRAPFHFLGRINREHLLMWEDIGRNTRYEDVVVSPVLEALPITKEIGASNKLIHHAANFSEVDRVVERVCGKFNVVLALPKGTEAGEFGSRAPNEVIDTGRIRLLRYASYTGKAAGCS
ncbi:hypothetical protein [Bradyrhizobium guangdongense]|uniref:hypothetical protein n=1 Tax=Bradyrhizobium guangdongense TaxID=1325090 RepID=UPI00112C62A1|nr:hypothetical protein [Bradyrhizobium guangdongense]